MGFTIKEKPAGRQTEITVTDNAAGSDRSAKFFDSKLMEVTLDGNTVGYYGNDEANIVRFKNGNSVTVSNSPYLGQVVDIKVNDVEIRGIPISEINNLRPEFKAVYKEADKLKLKADQCLADMSVDAGIRRNNHLQPWANEAQGKLNSRLAQAQHEGASHGTQGNRKDDQYDENIDVALGRMPDYGKANKQAAQREEAIRREIRKQQQSARR